LVKSDVIIEGNQQEPTIANNGRVFHIPKKALANSFPYESLKDLYKNESFKNKFKQIYVFGTKNPTHSFLTQLI
jgi:hypothetical protein